MNPHAENENDNPTGEYEFSNPAGWTPDQSVRYENIRMKHLKQDMDGYLNIEEIITESNIGNEMIKSKGAKKSGNTN